MANINQLNLPDGTTVDIEDTKARGVVCTQAQYDAWEQAGTLDPDVNYFISDANSSTPIYASGVHYDNTNSGLDADDVQEAIDELNSDKVSNELVSGTFTLQNGYSFRGTPSIKKQGNIVSLQFNITATTAFTSRVTLGTLSTGFRPPATYVFTVAASTGVNYYANIVTTLLIASGGDVIAGDICVPSGSSIKEVIATISYIV